MLLAASTGVDATIVVLVLVVWVIPAYVARRIAKRKGLPWLRYALRGWFGVLRLSLRKPKGGAAGGLGSTYHVPPGAKRRR